MGAYQEGHLAAAVHGRRRHRIWRGVLVAMLFVGAVAACGTSRPVDIQAGSPSHRDAAAAAVGSDRHLVNLSREIARNANAHIGSDRHLEELARQARTGP